MVLLPPVVWIVPHKQVTDHYSWRCAHSRPNCLSEFHRATYWDLYCFYLYVNYLPDCHLASDIILYADGTVIYFSSKNVSAFEGRINADSRATHKVEESEGFALQYGITYEKFSSVI